MKASDSVAPGRRRRWGRAVLVGGQVAVSVVLLVVAMFMYRGFREQLASGPGYRTDHLLMMSFDTSLVRYTEAQSQQFFEQVAERARAVPGVTTVTMTTSIPMSNDSIGTVTIAPEGFQFPPGKENVTVLAVARRRTLLRHDGDRAARRAATSRARRRRGRAARRHREPAARAALLAESGSDRQAVSPERCATRRWVEIVGVAKTSKYLFIAEPPTDFVYLPYRQQKPRADDHGGAVRRRSGRAGRAAARGRPRPRRATCRSSTCGRWSSSTRCGRSASSTCSSRSSARWG